MGVDPDEPGRDRVLGALAWHAVVAALVAVDPVIELIVGAGVALLGYLAWCWVLPWKRCPSCGGDDKIRDKAGNYNRYTCWRCGGRDYPRIGTRLIGGNRG